MTSNHLLWPLSARSRMNPDEMWKHLEAAFEDDADWLQGLRLEEEGEALDRSSPKEVAFVCEDDEDLLRKLPKESDYKIGPEIKHPQLVAFRRTDDAAELKARLDQARAAIPKLETLFEARAVTPEFLLQWGAFQFCCGFISSSYFSLSDDPGLGYLRAGTTGGRPRRDRDRKWIALLLIRQLDKGRSRGDAEVDIARAIRAAVKSKPDGNEERAWLESFLNEKQDLRSTFCERNFTLPAVRAAVRLPHVIPPVDGFVPEN